MKTCLKAPIKHHTNGVCAYLAPWTSDKHIFICPLTTMQVCSAEMSSNEKQSQHVLVYRETCFK